MPLDLAEYKTKARSAIKRFWAGEKAGSKKKVPDGLDGFKDLIIATVCANGLTRAHVLLQDQPLSLPGHFSANQSWDLVVVNEGRLVAAIKLDSIPNELLATHAVDGCKEVLSTAMELRAAYRRGAFGESRKPFVGYLMLLEDAPASRAPVKDVSPNFPIFPEFQDASYADRYRILCEKLMAEELYSAAAVTLSPRTAFKSGVYSEMSELTGLKSFLTSLAGHIAAEAAM